MEKHYCKSCDKIVAGYSDDDIGYEVISCPICDSEVEDTVLCSCLGLKGESRYLCPECTEHIAQKILDIAAEYKIKYDDLIYEADRWIDKNGERRTLA